MIEISPRLAGRPPEAANLDTSESPAHRRLQALLAKVDDLAVLPHVVFKVLEVSADTADHAGKEMEKAILVDPGFSSKVLVRANSAAYGLPRRVTAIREAIAFLGYRAVRNVAMTVGVYDLFVGKTDRESLRRREWWRHSIDSAICARWLSQELRKGYPEEGYTCALLHLLGKTLLDRVGEGDYSNVEDAVAAGSNVLDAELKEFGTHHVIVGCAAAVKWGLPQTLVEGMAYAEAPSPEADHKELCALTSLGSFIASVAKAGYRAGETELVPPVWALEILGVPETQLDSLIESGLAVIAAASRS